MTSGINMNIGFNIPPRLVVVSRRERIAPHGLCRIIEAILCQGASWAFHCLVHACWRPSALPHLWRFLPKFIRWSRDKQIQGYTENPSRSDTVHEDYGTKLGERVLKDVRELSQQRWGSRLVAVYALGSLAHGGFSAHVSDVDVGLVLAEPLEENDAKGIDHLSRSVKQSGLPLADRLSVFWGSVATCSDAANGGRFPPVDRLDLIESGRLLIGKDVRAGMPKPTVRDMVLAAARISVKSLSSAEVMSQLNDPVQLVQAGVRSLTKRVLFPVRFLFTARTGKIGATDLAVEHFAAVERGPAVELAIRALEWRYAPLDPFDAAALACIERGLLPLHRLYIDDYEARLRSYGETDLVRGFSELRRLYGFD